MADCIFCKIANHELDTNILYEDQHLIAIYDINPKAPKHVLIIPKLHIASLAQAKEEHVQLLGQINYRAAKLAEELGIAADGYRLITNIGANSGQEVPHLHYHLIGGKALGSFVGE